MGRGWCARRARFSKEFSGPRVHDYLDAIGATTQAVVYALILGAIAQGTVAGIGYFFAGVEAPVLMGAITVLVALIPFGAPLVWGSLALWMLVTGDLWHGIGLLLWGLLVVSWVDNLVRPMVISNATRMPFLLVVFGVLGGVLAFGLVGLFIGPVLLAVSLAIWREWLEEHQEKKAASPTGRLFDLAHSRILSIRTPSMSMISTFRSRHVSVSPALGCGRDAPARSPRPCGSPAAPCRGGSGAAAAPRSAGDRRQP